MTTHEPLPTSVYDTDLLVTTAVGVLYPFFYPVQSSFIQFEERSPGSQYYFQSVVTSILVDACGDTSCPSAYDLAESIYLVRWRNKSMSVPFFGLPVHQQEMFLSFARLVIGSIGVGEENFHGE